MTEDEARMLAELLRRLDRPGIAAPADPDRPDGEWRIYDRPEPGRRQDITNFVLAALDAVAATEAATLPAGGPPVRGFVIPSYGSTR